MRRRAIAGRRGGSGKTTTTINLAGALVETGLRIALVDLHPHVPLTRVRLGSEARKEGLTVRRSSDRAAIRPGLRTSPLA